MAQFAVHGTPRSVAALAAFFTFVGLMVYAMAGGVEDLPAKTRVTYGLILYLVSFLVIGLGFWSKEDTIAMGGIIGFSLLMVLDILLRIGILSYNGIKVL